MNQIELCHIWANEKRKNAKSNSMFFRDKTIYSYGTHFPIAKNLPDNIVLFTEKKYSITTAKHIAYTRQSISSNKTIISVYHVNDSGFEKENLTYMKGKIIDTLKKAYRSRKYKAYYLKDVKSMLENMELYLNLRKSVLHNDTRHYRNFIRNTSIGLDSGDIEEAIKNQIEVERKKEKIKQAKIRAENADKIDRWKNGENLYLPRLEYALLRIKNDLIETSQGASVSLQEGRILWLLIKANKPIIGHVVSGYTVLSFNGELKIGCHKIERSEIDRIGALLDYLEAANKNSADAP